MNIKQLSSIWEAIVNLWFERRFTRLLSLLSSSNDFQAEVEGDVFVKYFKHKLKQKEISHTFNFDELNELKVEYENIEYKNFKLDFEEVYFYHNDNQ